MTQEELEFVYRWVWVDEWHQPLKDFDDTPYEYIMGLFEARKWTKERGNKKGGSGDKFDQMEQDVLKRSGALI